MTDAEERHEPDLERVREALREADERSHPGTERDREARERPEDADRSDRRGAPGE